MDILIVVATSLEISPLISWLDSCSSFSRRESQSSGQLSKSQWGGESKISTVKYESGGGSVTILIGGIGMTFTAYSLTKELCLNRYDLVINSGFAGAYSRELNIGEVVSVISEEIMDHGAITPDGFKTLFEKGFADENQYPFKGGKLHIDRECKLSSTATKPFREAIGATANSLTGTEWAINHAIEKYNPDVESMEGAAVHYIVQLEGISFVQLRVISNYVEPYAVEEWDVSLAKESLRVALRGVIIDLLNIKE